MNVCVCVWMWETATERTDVQGSRALLIPSVFSISVSYVTWIMLCLVGLVPRSRSASNTLTHIQCLWKNWKMCPQIPSPRALCTVYLCVWESVCVCACVHSPVFLFDLHTPVVCGCYAPCRNVPKTFVRQCIRRCCILIVRDTSCYTEKICSQEFLFSTPDAPVSPWLPVYRWRKGLIVLLNPTNIFNFFLCLSILV